VVWLDGMAGWLGIGGIASMAVWYDCWCNWVALLGGIAWIGWVAWYEGGQG